MNLARCAIAFLVLLPAPAFAQRFDDTITVRLESYFAGINSTARLDGPTGNGTEIDFEDDLGMRASKTLPALEIGWRINDDWLLQGQYYALNRRTEATLDRDIVVDDVVYPVSARVGAGFDSPVYRFTINNLVFQGERLEIGLGIGLHATNFKVFIEGEASVPGVGGTSFRREERSIFAPLPTVGAIGQWEPAPRFTLFGRLDWLSLSIDDYSGRLLNAEASASYSLFKWLDVGASYRYVDYRLSVDKNDWSGRLRYQFSGPSLFLRAGF